MPPLLKRFERQLFLAAHRGDVDALRSICEANAPDASVNICDEASYTPLTIAIVQGSLETVQALVNLGADVTKGDMKGLTPAQIAVDEGHLEILRFLVEQGADPSLQRGKAGNLLHVAAIYGYLEIVQWLVQVCGVPVNAPIQETGRTALHVASSTHRDATVRWLLANGADPLACDYDSKTALHHAISRNCSPDTPTIFQLIRSGGSEGLAAQDRFGRTALHEACYRRKTTAARILIENNANLLTIDHFGHTPLFEVSCCDAELLELMLNKLQTQGMCVKDIRKELNRTDQIGWAALHHAIFCGESTVVKCLLSYGARVEMLEKPRLQSALHLVGANFSIDWEQRATKAPQALHAQYKHVTDWLLDYGKCFLRYPQIRNGWPPARIPPLPEISGFEDCFRVNPSSNGGGTAMSKLLLKQGVSVMVKDEDGNLPFFLPASIGNVSEVFLMLRAAAHEGMFRNVVQEQQSVKKTSELATTKTIPERKEGSLTLKEPAKRSASQIYSTAVSPVTPSPRKRAAHTIMRREEDDDKITSSAF